MTALAHGYELVLIYMYMYILKNLQTLVFRPAMTHQYSSEK